ncbi:MAG TPA: hypothetical protein VFA77_13755, partial [Candidatus Eisenbacteria bacterium]|nr:hypothetical protein [Candidatus Eisenbacteria bacterium]
PQGAPGLPVGQAGSVAVHSATCYFVDLATMNVSNSAVKTTSYILATFVNAGSNSTDARVTVLHVVNGAFQIRVTGCSINTDFGGATPDRVNYIIINQ